MKPVLRVGMDGDELKHRTALHVALEDLSISAERFGRATEVHHGETPTDSLPSLLELLPINLTKTADSSDTKVTRNTFPVERGAP